MLRCVHYARDKGPKVALMAQWESGQAAMVHGFLCASCWQKLSAHFAAIAPHRELIRHATKGDVDVSED